MLDDGCVWVTSGQRIGMVPAVIVDDLDAPFRLAEHGEPAVPAWIEDTVCTIHEETSFSWRQLDIERLAAAQNAIDLGCDPGCRCQCHDLTLGY